MSVHQVRAARRKMVLRYRKAPKRSVAEAIAAERRAAARAAAASKKKK